MNVDKITFDLSLSEGSKNIEVPLLLARGYSKRRVIELFEKLQEEGFGVFDRGKKGRSNIAKFIPNNNCPKEYTMKFIIKKRGRPRKMMKGEK
jgi:hypothetical protein